MFERYTEKARRVIFFARYEASQLGSPYIETEHLLLGILREDKAVANRFLRSHAATDSIRKQIEGRTTSGERVSTSVDLPLSHECKRVVAYGAEEAERLNNKHISTEHLLLGLLREEKCFAAEILHERGLRLSQVREEIARSSAENVSQQRPGETSLISRFGRDLTQEATDGQLNPVFARAQELERVVETLCRHANNNPVLIGEPAAAKSIVEALAQRIVDGAVPAILEDKKIVTFDLSLLEAESSGSGQCKELLKSLVRELSEAPNVVMVIEDMDGLFMSLSTDGWLDAAGLMKPHLLAGNVRCIAAAPSRGYSNVIQKHEALARCFHEVFVAPLNEAECLTLLVPLKQGLENFHGATFEEDAIAAAMAYAKQAAPEASLLSRAVDVLDAAGAQVQIRKGELPEDMRDVQKRIRFILNRMENAISNHEFEKARFYSDEEQKERENLRQLREKYRLEETSGSVPITQADIEGVIRLWAGTAAD